ncbi:hypothetical protein ES708_06156 [subsurface metagenome]
MSNKGKTRMFWELMSEDRDLVFFITGSPGNRFR